MRWEEHTQERPLFMDWQISQEIVYFAYKEGYISWNTYNKVLERIRTNINGSWMFVQGKENTENEK